MKRLFSCLTVFLLAAFCGIAALGAEEEKAPSRGVTIMNRPRLCRQHKKSP